MLHQGQVLLVEHGGVFVSSLRSFYDDGTNKPLNVLNTSIDKVIPEDTAKTILLLQGAEIE